jgi:hypothetical protein
MLRGALKNLGHCFGNLDKIQMRIFEILSRFQCYDWISRLFCLFFRCFQRLEGDSDPAHNYSQSSELPDRSLGAGI